MAVKARFYVSQVTKRPASGNATPIHEVTLTPVTRHTEDNVDWSQYTPSGVITMTLTKPGAQEWFNSRLGEDISVTFEDVPDVE